MSESIDVIKTKSSHEWITGTFFLDFSKVCHGCHDFMQKWCFDNLAIGSVKWNDYRIRFL